VFVVCRPPSPPSPSVAMASMVVEELQEQLLAQEEELTRREEALVLREEKARIF
jgi:hypothetical protein